MKAKVFVQQISKAGIRVITGVPDSTLKQFCTYINKGGNDLFESHIVTADEGAAVGIAIGEYLSTGNPACVYMQNSGLGNVVNPATSLAHREVYGIPMLFVIGWRGEPGTEDEPQHRFMGQVTLELLELLEISYAVINGQTTAMELENILKQAGECFQQGKQYALVVKKGTFEKEEENVYENGWTLKRECAIETVTDWLQPNDIVVSTTGKISRELYEKLDEIKGSHRQAFLTVGGMGYAKMVAYGIALRNENRRVICLDGDGALLMHMGGLAIIGSQPLDNLIHICLDNEAHESVGGMPTGAVGIDYGKLAEICGYNNVYHAASEQELEAALNDVRSKKGMAFIHVKVAIGSRSNLGRPKELPMENKRIFMEMIGTV